MSSLLDDARSSVLTNAAHLRALESHAEARLRMGDHRSAAAWAQIAGHHGWRNHSGRFCLPRMERVLAEIAAALPAGPYPRRPGAVRRVLHVLTEAYDTGGHTRLAWNWMRRDRGRDHEVALTAPSEVPDALDEAAQAVHRLAGADPLTRAIELRALAASFDCVVLHVHMHDVVPILAFAGRGPASAPVVYVDHADHLLWLGTAVADVVTACRSPVQQVQVHRRNIPAGRSVLLPVPVDPAGRAEDRATAQAALGLGGRVLLTVASGHKYAPVVQPTFFDAAGAALEAVPDAMLVAVGPAPQDGGWAQLAERHPGRVQVLGRRSDLQRLRDAADAYLDSFPFSSNTSAIEAAAAGLPVVSFAPDPAGQGVLLTHDPGFEDHVLRAATPDAYAAQVRAALEDPGDLPRRLRDGALAAHGGDGWQGHLEEVYATALRLPPAPVPHDEDPGPVADWELIHHLLFRAEGTAGLPEASIVACLADLPAYERPGDDAELAEVAVWCGLRRARVPA